MAVPSSPPVAFNNQQQQQQQLHQQQQPMQVVPDAWKHQVSPRKTSPMKTPMKAPGQSLVSPPNNNDYNMTPKTTTTSTTAHDSETAFPAPPAFMQRAQTVPDDWKHQVPHRKTSPMVMKAPSPSLVPSSSMSRPKTTTTSSHPFPVPLTSMQRAQTVPDDWKHQISPRKTSPIKKKVSVKSLAGPPLPATDTTTDTTTTTAPSDNHNHNYNNNNTSYSKVPEGWQQQQKPSKTNHGQHRDHRHSSRQSQIQNNGQQVPQQKQPVVQVAPSTKMQQLQQQKQQHQSKQPQPSSPSSPKQRQQQQQGRSSNVAIGTENNTNTNDHHPHSPRNDDEFLSDVLQQRYQNGQAQFRRDEQQPSRRSHRQSRMSTRLSSNEKHNDPTLRISTMPHNTTTTTTTTNVPLPAPPLLESQTTASTVPLVLEEDPENSEEFINDVVGKAYPGLAHYQQRNLEQTDDDDDDSSHHRRGTSSSEHEEESAHSRGNQRNSRSSRRSTTTTTRNSPTTATKRGCPTIHSGETYQSDLESSKIPVAPMATEEDIYKPGAFQVSSDGVRVNAKGHLTELPTSLLEHESSLGSKHQANQGLSSSSIHSIMSRMTSMGRSTRPMVGGTNTTTNNNNNHNDDGANDHNNDPSHENYNNTKDHHTKNSFPGEESSLSHQAKSKASSLRCACLGLICLILIAAIVIPIVIVVGKRSNETPMEDATNNTPNNNDDKGDSLSSGDTEENNPSENTEIPVPIESTEKLQQFFFLLQEANLIPPQWQMVNGITDIWQTSSSSSALPPQLKAAYWLTELDPAQLDLDTTPRRELLERYIMALFLFSTDTSLSIIIQSRENDMVVVTNVEDYSFPILTETSICDWNDGFSNGIFCDHTHTDMEAQEDEENPVTRVSFVRQGLDGIIPSELFTLSSLQTLRLDLNSLQGTLPTGLASGSSLIEVQLDSNPLLNIVIPDDLTLLSSLEILNLGSTRLSPSIPTSIGSLTALTSLDLSGNERLGGTIPTEVGLLGNLRVLNLGSTLLESSIPSELGMLVELSELTLENTRLSGSIPSELSNLTNLQTLRLANTDVYDDSVIQQLCLNDVGWLYFAVNCPRQLLCTCCQHDDC